MGAQATNEGGGGYWTSTPELGPVNGPWLPMSPLDRIIDFLTPKISGGSLVAEAGGQFTQHSPADLTGTWAEPSPKPITDDSFPWAAAIGGGALFVLVLALIGRR